MNNEDILDRVPTAARQEMSNPRQGVGNDRRTAADAAGAITENSARATPDMAVALTIALHGGDHCGSITDDADREMIVTEPRGFMVSRGYASLSFLNEAAETIAASGKPVFVYHLGDFDPSGVNAGEKIEEALRALAPDAEIHFERLAVTPRQIVDWRLPTRPTKASDSRAKAFDSTISVELDAIPPDDLRGLVERAIARHMPPARYAWLMAEGETERGKLAALVEGLTG